jgi:hypothetical protein
MWPKWKTWKTEEIINNLSPDSKLTNTKVEQILKEFSNNISTWYSGKTVLGFIERLNAHFLKNQKQIVQYIPIALFCSNYLSEKDGYEKLQNDLMIILTTAVNDHFEALVESSKSEYFSKLIKNHLPKKHTGILEIDSIFGLIEMACDADDKLLLTSIWSDLFNARCKLKDALDIYELYKPKFKVFKGDDSFENHLLSKMLLELVFIYILLILQKIHPKEFLDYFESNHNQTYFNYCCRSIIFWENGNIDDWIKNLIKIGKGKDLYSPFQFIVQAFHEKKTFMKMILVLKHVKEISQKTEEGDDSIYQQLKGIVLERVQKNPSAYSIDNLIEYFLIYSF